MLETITTGAVLDATPVGSIVRSAKGELGEVQNTGGHNCVAFVRHDSRIWWTDMQRFGQTPLTLVLVPSEEASLRTDISILHPGGARNTTIPTAYHLVELTIENATDYVARRNAYEGDIAVVQTRKTTDWETRA